MLIFHYIKQTLCTLSNVSNPIVILEFENKFKRKEISKARKATKNAIS